MSTTMLDTDILLKYNNPPPNRPDLQCYYTIHTDPATINSSTDDPLFGNVYDLLSHLKLNHPDPHPHLTHLLLASHLPGKSSRGFKGDPSLNNLLTWDFKPNHPFYDKILVSTNPIYIGPTDADGPDNLSNCFSCSPAPKKILLPFSSYGSFPKEYRNKRHQPLLPPPLHVHANEELGFFVISTSPSAAQRSQTISRNISLSIARLRLLHCDIPSPLFHNFLNLSYSASTIEPPSPDHWKARNYNHKQKYDGGFPPCDFQSLFLQRASLHPHLLARRRLRPHYLSRLLALRPWLPYLHHLDRHASMCDSPSSPWAKAYNPKSYPLPTDIHEKTTYFTHFASEMRNLVSTSSGPKSTGNTQYTSKARLLATYIATELIATIRLYKSLPSSNPLRYIAHLPLPPILPLSLDLYLPPHLHSPSNVFPCPTTPPESHE